MKCAIKNIALLFGIILIISAAISGCSGDDPAASEDNAGNGINGGQEGESIGGQGEHTGYHWPWISHGELVLSNGSSSSGPDLFESSPGFIAEFPPGHRYSGYLYWLFEREDLLNIEWADLAFLVERYEDSEWISTAEFSFYLEGLTLSPGEEGIKRFDVDLVQSIDGFTFSLREVRIGIDQDSDYSSEPINYIALQVDMTAEQAP